MFGWEFPPHITGGLRTADFGLIKGLAKHGVEVFFVVPKVFGDECQEAVRMINASDVSIDMQQKIYKELWKRSMIYVKEHLKFMLKEEQFLNMMKRIGIVPEDDLISQQGNSVAGVQRRYFYKKCLLCYHFYHLKK